MVPEETQQVTDSLPKSQTKSDKTQLDSSVMVVTSTNVPEVLIASNGQENLTPLREQSSEDQVGDDTPMPQAPPDEDVNLVEAVSTELPLNVEEDLIREEDNISRHELDVILGQVVPEEFASRFPDLSYTLDIQGSASSNQVAQCTWSPSVLHQNITTAAESSPQGEHWASRTAPLGGGVQPPNTSDDRPTVNASADTSLPNNPMRQNLRFPSFSDIYDYQLEKLNREQGTLTKNFEETTAELKAERDRKLAEIQSEYDRKYQEVDAAYINQAMKEEVYRNSVVMSSLLSNGFMSKCTDKSVARASSSQRSTQQQQQQQQPVQRNTHVNSTPPLRPLVTTEAPIPDLSGPRLHSPRYNTTQPRPISQQAAVQSNTPMNSVTPPRVSVTAVDTPIPNPSGPLSHSPCYNTTQPRSQQAVVPSATHMTSSVTAADTPIPNPSGPPSPILRSNTIQPRPISQQATVQSNTPMNSSDLPQTSVTAVEPRTLHSPLNNTPQPRPISQQAMVRSNTQTNSTARPRPSVTSEALPLHSLLSNKPRPRPPPLIPNHIPSSYSPASASPVQGAVRAMAPHLRSSRPPNFAASASTATNQATNSAATAASTTNPTSLVQEQQQQQEKSNSGVVYLSDDE